MMRRSVHGFTLVELMVTLAVLTILVVMAVPSFEDYFQKARVRGAADQMTDLLARARATSVKGNMPIGVRVLSDGDDWCIGASQPIEPGAWGIRPTTAPNNCACLTDAGANACLVDGEKMVVLGSAYSTAQRPLVPETDVFFSYSPKLGGISVNSAPGRSFLSEADVSVMISSPNSRYVVNVVVTALGQAYVCIPPNKPSFAGYRNCPA